MESQEAVVWRWVQDLEEAGWPRDNEVQLLELTLPVALSEQAAAWDDLTEAERERARRYRSAEAQAQFVICRGALRRWLSKCLGVPPRAVALTLNAQGKPLLAEHRGEMSSALHFNVAHTSGRGLLALARRPVGVDVERLRPLADLDGLLRRYFTPREQAACRQSNTGDRLEVFFQLWTGKEAVIKAAGLSIAALGEFELQWHGPQTGEVTAPRRPELCGRWLVRWWKRELGWQAAVAVRLALP